MNLGWQFIQFEQVLLATTPIICQFQTGFVLKDRDAKPSFYVLAVGVDFWEWTWPSSPRWTCSQMSSLTKASSFVFLRFHQILGVGIEHDQPNLWIQKHDETWSATRVLSAEIIDNTARLQTRKRRWHLNAPKRRLNWWSDDSNPEKSRQKKILQDYGPRWPKHAHWNLNEFNLCHLNVPWKWPIFGWLLYESVPAASVETALVDLPLAHLVASA